VFLDMVLPESAMGRKKETKPSRWSFNRYASSPDVAVAYRRSLREAGPGVVGAPVSGIIYEMSSLMVPVTGAVTKQGEVVTKQGPEAGGDGEGEWEPGRAAALSEYEAEKLRNVSWRGATGRGTS